MRYHGLLSILDANPTYAIFVYVGRLRFQVNRNQLIEEMTDQRGMNFRVEFEVDHDLDQIVILEKP
jgi:hypothetical protein